MSSPVTFAVDAGRVVEGVAVDARDNSARRHLERPATPDVKRVVILGSSITALGTAREAHGLGLSPIIVDNASGIAHRSSLVEVAPFREGTETEYLEQICATGGPDTCLVSTADFWLRFLRRNREVLESAFGSILHPSNEALDVCLNKLAFADWCLAHHLRTPKHCHGNDAVCLQRMGYPVMVRPAETLHHRPHADIPKAAEVESAETLAALIGRYRAAGVAPLIAESLLGRRLIQYSIPFARRGSEINSFVARKVRPPANWCATGTCVELSPNAEVEALARRAIEALDYFGIGEVEILHSPDDGCSYLVEINARPWLQYALATASGHNFLGFLLKPNRAGASPALKEGMTWLNFSGDFYVCFSRSQGIVRRGNLGVLDYLKSIFKANVYARFCWRDPKPWLLDSLDWLRSLVRR